MWRVRSRHRLWTRATQLGEIDAEARAPWVSRSESRPSKPRVIAGLLRRRLSPASGPRVRNPGHAIAVTSEGKNCDETPDGTLVPIPKPYAGARSRCAGLATREPLVNRQRSGGC
jgi:hypothetical protein